MVNTGKATSKAQNGPVKSGRSAIAKQSIETKQKTRSGTKRALTMVNKESEITKSPPKKAIKMVTNVKAQGNKAKEKILSLLHRRILVKLALVVLPNLLTIMQSSYQLWVLPRA